MKKFNPKMIPAFLVALVFSVNLIAQETVVTVKVEKDGKVVKDTSYSFEDGAQAEHALKMMDIMCADDEHMMEIHKTMSEKHGEHSKTMIFISEDGETKEITEIHGDSLVWIAEGEHDGDQVKVMKYRVEVGDDIHEDHEGEHVKVMKYEMDDDAHGKHVVVVKSGDGETFDILIDEDCEGEEGDEKIVKTKVVKVTVEDDQEKKKSKKQ